MVKLPQILAKTHVTRNAYRHWGLIGALKTEQPETSMGKAVPYSRENALEIAFIGALVRAGLTPTDASGRAQYFLKALSVGALEPFYAINPITGFGFGLSRIDDPESLKKIIHALNRQEAGGWVDFVPFIQVHIVNVAHLVEIVDELFNEEVA